MEANEGPKTTAKKKAWWIRVLDKWKKPFHDKWFRPRRDSVGKAIGYAALYGFVWLILLLLIWVISVFRFMLRSILKSWDTLLASVCTLVLGAFGMSAYIWVKGWQPIHEVLIEVPIIKDLPEDDAGRYIARWKDAAIETMHTHDIPASITLAQGLLESRNGLSELTADHKNHFGMKCGSSWTGDRVYYNDDAEGECFRKYDTDLESFQDHARLLRNKHYEKYLKNLSPKDYKAWATGLKSAGYATAPHYAKSLIKVIERYDLHQYD